MSFHWSCMCPSLIPQDSGNIWEQQSYFSHCPYIHYTFLSFSVLKLLLWIGKMSFNSMIQINLFHFSRIKFTCIIRSEYFVNSQSFKQLSKIYQELFSILWILTDFIAYAKGVFVQGSMNINPNLFSCTDLMRKCPVASRLTNSPGIVIVLIDLGGLAHASS